MECAVPIITLSALVGFQGLMLKGASATRKSLIRPLKSNGFKEVVGLKIALDAFVKSTPLESNKSPVLMLLTHSCRLLLVFGKTGI